jgi:hypothetical protein
LSEHFRKEKNMSRVRGKREASYSMSAIVCLMLLLLWTGKSKGQEAEAIQDSTFTIWVWDQKTDFLFQEPVWVFVRKINASQQKELIDSAVLDQCFYVSDSKGREYPPALEIETLGEPGIEPGDTITSCVDIGSEYSIKGDYGMWDNLPPAKYEIYARLSFGKQNTVIRSNKIEFTVSLPEGDEISH